MRDTRKPRLPARSDFLSAVPAPMTVPSTRVRSWATGGARQSQPTSMPRSNSTPAPTVFSSPSWSCSRRSPRSFEEPVNRDIDAEVGAELVERRLDEGIVGDRSAARGEALKPARALAVVGKQSVDIRADHASVGRDRAFGHAAFETRERAPAVRSLGHAHMHLVAAEWESVCRRAACRFEPLLFRQHGLDIEQGEAGRASRLAFDPAWIVDGAAEHLIAAA